MFKKRNVSLASGSKRRLTNTIDKDLSDSDSDFDQVVVPSKKVKPDNNSFFKTKPVDIGKVEYGHSNSTELKDSASDLATMENRLYREAKENETLNKKSQMEMNNLENGAYKGLANYNKFTDKSSENKSKFGPVKSVSANITTSTVIDYQPDVCKDYKQTGFCGYGDSCKFLHSREDYKAGWKLDQDWEEAQILIKGKPLKEGETEHREGKSKIGDSGTEDIPFKCIICKTDYKNPVVTNCKHYFCEQCFLKEYRNKPGCFLCGKETHGIAKPAKDLSKLLASRRKE